MTESPDLLSFFISCLRPAFCVHQTSCFHRLWQICLPILSHLLEPWSPSRTARSRIIKILLPLAEGQTSGVHISSSRSAAYTWRFGSHRVFCEMGGRVKTLNIVTLGKLLRVWHPIEPSDLLERVRPCFHLMLFWRNQLPCGFVKFIWTKNMYFSLKYILVSLRAHSSKWIKFAFLILDFFEGWRKKYGKMVANLKIKFSRF